MPRWRDLPDHPSEEKRLYRPLAITGLPPERPAALTIDLAGALARTGVPVMDDLIIKIDRNIDEVLVNLGRMVLRLSSPQVTRTREERQALA